MSPDKRTIFIHQEKKIVDAMKVKIIISLSDSRASMSYKILLIGYKTNIESIDQSIWAVSIDLFC